MTFNPRPKPIRTCKGKECNEPPEFSGWCMSCYFKNKSKKKSEYIKKQQVKKAPQVSADDAFYISLYKKAVAEDKWVCSETGVRLPEIDLTDPKASYEIRKYCHHIIKKSTHPQFRYVLKNILLLSWDSHQQAEYPVSFEKMKIYPYCMSIRQELLEENNLED